MIDEVYPTKILTVYNSVKRADFVLPEHKELAELNIALPIPGDQSISQPTTVLDMLDWLDVKKGDKVLDVGFGSGWTTALLSNLTGPDGKVFATEINEETFEFGKKNIERQKLENVVVFLSKGELGLKSEAPFDKILVSAYAPEVPQSLVDQLADQGKMVIPVNVEIFEIKKIGEEINITPHEAYLFVPLKY
jgi:protein-L-isoaspartate(D-aspartate) O-methyltransferase